MSHSVILPSTLASPSRVFLSPFPPPNQQQKQQKRSAKDDTKQKKHSICPYKISTDLARTCDIYNKQSPPHTRFDQTPLSALPPPKRSTSLVKSCDDSFLLDKCTLSPISTFSSSCDDDDDDFDNYDDEEDDYDVVSLYYYNRNTHDTTINQDEPFLNACPASSLSSYFSSITTSTSSSSSLSISSPTRLRMRTSISTPLLKTRQSSPATSSPTTTRLPKWIKHVSQTSGLLEKKLSRGFPFRSTVPVPLHMMPTSDQVNTATATAITTTTKALYCGSPLVRQYLNSVTKANRFDDMLKFGFPCPNSLHLHHHHQQQNNVDKLDDDDDDDDNGPLTATKKPQCLATCHQCAGQQRLMTLRVTVTPLHARANENDIYKSQNRKRSRKIRHTTHPMMTTTTTTTATTPCPL